MRTTALLKQVFPYLIFASAAGIALESFNPVKLIEESVYAGSTLSMTVLMLAGIPIYLCNGADIIVLQPLVKIAGLPLGTAVAFSLTSTSICLTSLIISKKIIGWKLTGILLVSVTILTFLCGLIINLIL